MNILEIPKKKYQFHKIENKNQDIYFYRNYLDRFIDFLLSNYDNQTLSNFYHNINSLKINQRDFEIVKLTGKEYEGCYTSFTNTIDICYLDALYHELFHMASSNFYKKENMIYNGFSQIKIGKEYNERIGIALNEGYTDYLCSKYFYKSDDDVSYQYESFIVSKIEEIIGSNKMERLYISADLYGLVKELMNYLPKEDIIVFINLFDSILLHEDDPNKYYENIRTKIYYFLYNLRLIKIKRGLNNYKIYSDKEINLFENFIISFKESGYLPKKEQDLYDTYSDTSKKYSKVK